MAEVEYMHICDYAFPGQGDKPCMIGVFDRIFASSFPAAQPYMSIAVQIHGTPHEIVKIKIELGRANGDVLVSMEGELSVNANGGAFLNFNMVNTQFPEPGRYVVKVSSAGRTLVSQSLHLMKAQGPTQPGPQGTPPSVH
jgi:hypothetical protein